MVGPAREGFETATAAATKVKRFAAILFVAVGALAGDQVHILTTIDGTNVFDTGLGIGGIPANHAWIVPAFQVLFNAGDPGTLSLQQSFDWTNFFDAIKIDYYAGTNEPLPTFSLLITSTPKLQAPSLLGISKP